MKKIKLRAQMPPELPLTRNSVITEALVRAILKSK